MKNFLEEIKDKYGSRLAFWGAISTQATLPCTDEDGVRKAVKETLEIMRVGGGYILAPTHAIPQDVPEKNVIAMLEAFNNQ